MIVFIFWVLGEPGMIFNWYFKLIERLPSWVAKPLGDCLVCFSGQALFHFYWITHLHNYNFIEQLFYPALGIFLVTIYEKIYNYEKT